ncbi:DUF222 domain-containing protein [Microbacterium sp. CFH 90308]|uniref:DUF222 domain-containing protein n=1 Tax=Microbacterium salsuginis TaxID=2722803 RepID=A0ABX1KDE1_9MICO|nr:HNH endonuclease signature motif containing protein [Microbacterium sp. CFH 90308]NLP85049.1 DUF222 domain-containing protein [Microbacterium sp. CFH 90308]
MGDERTDDETFAVSPPADEYLGYLLDDVVSDHMDANRRLARRAVNIVEAVDFAERRPYVYTTADGELATKIAERAVVFDVSLRLQLGEKAVRDLIRLTRDARRWLPQLWRRAEEGYVALPLVDSTLAGAYRLLPAPDATKEEKDAAAAAVRELDSRADDWAVACTPAGFRSRLARLVEKLDARRADERHAMALRDRRVIVEHAGDGMSWVSALVPTLDAVAIKRRLTATAKHVAKDRAETRSRDQIRADLFSGWLRGAGTPTAVKTKVFVTVPVTLLAGGGDAPNPSVPVETAEIVGHGPIPPLVAKQLFLDAKAFRRLITDPVRGVVVDMDRRVYRSTGAQRDWIVLQHHLCTRDGCTRLAMEADIDHDVPWSQGGKTNLRLLRPLCPPDHGRRHQTTFAYRTRENGTVEVSTPTGYTTPEEPPF